MIKTDPGRNGHQHPSGDEPDMEELVKGFLAAARRLRDGAAWHQRRAAQYAAGRG